MVGFSYQRQSKSYRARVRFEGRSITLGMYKTSENAGLAYDKKMREIKTDTTPLELNYSLAKYNELLEACGGHIKTVADLKRESKSSKYRGVRWFKRDSKWKVQINVKSSQLHLGYYDDEVEAAKAYDAAVILHSLDKTKMNFPGDEVDGPPPQKNINMVKKISKCAVGGMDGPSSL